MKKKAFSPVEEGICRIRQISRILLWGSLVFMFAILLKAFFLQIVGHDRWVGLYEAQTITQIQRRFPRLPIVDRNGKLLAITVIQPSICADPSRIKSPVKTARFLSSKLSVSYSVLLKRLKSKKRFVWVKRYVSDQVAQEIRRRSIDGVYVIREMKRFYPHRTLAGQVIGFSGWDGHGLEGVERYYDSKLVVKPKSIKSIRDALGRTVWVANMEDLTNNGSLRLSLDSYIQYVAERELAKACAKYHPSSAQVIVMDPWTFEILAMVNWPYFDPNVYRYSNPNVWRNRAITDVFEPGSTFKPIVVAAALECGIITPNSKFFCENGSFRVPGHTIRDVHPHGWLSVAEVIKFSSNIGAAKIAQELGARKFYEFIKKIGFGKVTEIDLPGEASGIVRLWNRWQPVDLATAAFGQGIGVTTLQLAVSFSAIANGGFVAKPYVVSNNSESKEKTVRVMSKTTALMLKKMLNMVTKKGGTGTRAAIEGYEVAGKTGTAQRIDPETGRYSAHGYSSIFVGFAPLEDPKIVIAVVIHEPHGAVYGGVVAAPVFREIASDILPYLGVFPDNKG